MHYKKLRKYRGKDTIWADAIFSIFSPFTTQLMIKLNLIPNEVTVLMIISGIIGAILFAMPNIFLKILGTFFIYLWYLLDCSDGELARIKNKYSLFGKEIDYLAHFINHPLFCVSFGISIIQLDRWNFKKAIFIFLGILICNFWMRVISILEHIITMKNPNNKVNKRSNWKRIIITIWANTVFLPNFTFIFPVAYFVDYYYYYSISYYISLMLLISTLSLSIAKILHVLKKIMYK